jgi:imidazolonepropionase-like amidohydrolase
LVDTHAHLALASPAPESASATERVRASANAHLEAGVLAVREPGSPDHASFGIGPHLGLPRVITAGQFLAPAGHYLENLARDASEEELPAAAEDEARKSGAWAKVIGDWIDADGRFTPNYRTGALAEAARRVHAIGGRIAVHATTAASIESAIEAGFDSIEHGVGLSDEHISAMAAHGTVLVPTLIILPGITEWMQRMGLPAHVLRPTLNALKRHPEMTRRAAEAGVMVLAGTDAGMGPHGMVRTEIGLLQAAGIAQEQALGAGSWIARRFLGFAGIAEGAPADVVAYSSDPRHDPEALSRPVLRILDGKVIGQIPHSH